MSAAISPTVRVKKPTRSKEGASGATPSMDTAPALGT